MGTRVKSHLVFGIPMGEVQMDHPMLHYSTGISGVETWAHVRHFQPKVETAAMVAYASESKKLLVHGYDVIVPVLDVSNPGSAPEEWVVALRRFCDEYKVGWLDPGWMIVTTVS